MKNSTQQMINSDYLKFFAAYNLKNDLKNAVLNVIKDVIPRPFYENVKKNALI